MVADLVRDHVRLGEVTVGTEPVLQLLEERQRRGRSAGPPGNRTGPSPRSPDRIRSVVEPRNSTISVSSYVMPARSKMSVPHELRRPRAPPPTNHPVGSLGVDLLRCSPTRHRRLAPKGSSAPPSSPNPPSLPRHRGTHEHQQEQHDQPADADAALAHRDREPARTQRHRRWALRRGGRSRRPRRHAVAVSRASSGPPVSVAEVPYPGDHHGHASGLGGGQDLVVALRAAGMDHGGAAGVAPRPRGRRGTGRTRRRRRPRRRPGRPPCGRRSTTRRRATSARRRRRPSHRRARA